MVGLFLMSWVVAPAAILLVVAGLGLLARHVSGGALAALHVLPVGFATLLVTAALLTQLATTAPLTGVGIAGLASVGLVLERGTLRSANLRSLAWPAAAALAAFAAVAAPAVLAGSPGFTGYTRIVDIGHQLDFGAYLVKEGHTSIPVPHSSFEVIARGLINSGYPSGWQGSLAGFGQLLHTDLLWLYQPFLAFTSGIGALALYSLLGRALPFAPVRAIAAGVAIQANVLYGYGLVGGFKELAIASLLALVAVLVRSSTFEAARWRRQIPLALALGACLTTFSLAAVPWLAIMLGGFLFLAVWERRGSLTAWRSGAGRGAVSRRTRLGWTGLATVMVALSLPAAVAAVKLGKVAAGADAGSEVGRTQLGDLGNLAAAMPVKAAAGVWVAADYRYPSDVLGGITDVLIVITVGLAIVGLVTAIRRRDWSLAMLGIASVVALTYYANRTGPWIQLKAIAVTGPASLACAFAGVAALVRARSWRTGAAGFAVTGVGLLLGSAVAGGVLLGNAKAYHETWVAPASRLHDLEQIGKRFGGKGPAFYPDFEELSEYLLRDEGATVTVSPPPGLAPRLRTDPRTGEPIKRGGQIFSYDLDDLDPRYVQSFSLIVARRSPLRSRPPSNWRLTERTRYHDVWERVRPGSTVLLHEPPPAVSTPAACRLLARRARRAGGQRLAYVETPFVRRFPLGDIKHSGNWSGRGGSLYVTGRGEASGRFELSRSGPYRVWLQGTFGRALTVELDGRRVGQLKMRHNYPGQFELVGTIQLNAGGHRVRISRGGGNLEPGNGDNSFQQVGPLVLARIGEESPSVRTTAIGDAYDVCRRGRLDWIEVVRVRG
jgi:hypothetical protein